MLKLKAQLAKIRPKDCLVIFDFDNTITQFDTLDDIIERFSINRNWVEVERAWKQGKMGSRQCLETQLGEVRINKKDLLKYLSTIKLDKDFKRLINLLRRKGIKFIILSDNFSYIINKILNNNGVKGIKIYANRLRFKKNRLLLSFPHQNISCLRCGHCKKRSLLKNNFRDKIIYIGDGLSDVCPARQSDIVFAKESLLRQLRKTRKQCLPISNLGQVCNYLKGTR